MRLYLLNSPILTDYGKYCFKEFTLWQAQELFRNYNLGYISAIGHESTAELLTRLLESEDPIPVNRVGIKMQVGDIALVFRLLTRLSEGQVLDISELSSKDYTFGFLKRLE